MATPYSSPDLYFRLQPVESHNWELAGQVLMAKQQKYDANLAQIENLVQQYVGLDIANKDAKNHLYNNLRTLTAEVDRVASTEDLSNSNATKNITAYIGQAIDETTINAVNTTRMKRQYDATWEEIRQKKPEMYNQANKAFGDAGWEEYINADKNADVSQYVRNGFAVIPYVDVEAVKNKNMMEYMKLAKDREYSVPIQIPKGIDKDGNTVYETIGFQEWVETGINPVVVRSMMQSQLTPEVSQQMMINSWSKYGGYKGEGAEYLKKDYSDLMDSRIQDAEDSIAKMELRLSSYGKGSDEEVKTKKDLSDYRTEIGRLKERKTATLASINSGNYLNAGLEIESGRFVDQGVGIFGSFYNKYFKGTKANEIYWKQLDLDQRQYEFSEKMRLDSDKLDLEQRKFEYQKDKDLRDEQALLDTGMVFTPSTQELSDKIGASEQENIQNVLDLKTNSNNITDSWIKDIDETITQEGTNPVKTSATALKEVYAKELGLKKGTYEKYTISQLRGTHDKYNDKINKILIENVGVSSPLSSLNTPNGGNRAQQLSEAVKRYKTAYSEVNKIRTDERNAVFTDDVVKEVLSSKNDAVVMVNRGGKMVVEKAKDAFKDFVNSDGSWKSTTTEAQKDAIRGRIQDTERVQRITQIPNLSRNSKESTISAISKAGLNPDDFTITKTVVSKSVSGDYLGTTKTVSETQYKAVPKKGTLLYDAYNLDNQSKSKLFKNNWFGENTNIARDGVFSDKIKTNRESARQQALQRHDTIRSSRMAQVNEGVISSKLNNGKVNPMFSEIANMINSTKGVIIDFSAGSTVTSIPNADGSFTFRTTVKSNKKGEENQVINMKLSADEVRRTLPTFYNQVNTTKQNEPINTRERLGNRKITVSEIPYYKDTEFQQALSVTGDPNLALAMTPNGAISMIQSFDPVAYQGLSNVFENFGQKLKEKVQNINGKYDLKVGFSPDFNTAEITMTTKDGSPVFTINRALDQDGSIDSTEKDVTYKPALVINQMLSELISVNYYRTNGDYDNSAWKLLMGDMKRK